MSRAYRFLINLLLLVASLVVAGRMIFASPYSADSYLHMAVGKYILTHHHIPKHKDLSYKDVEPSLEFIPHSWGSDILFYLSSKDSAHIAGLVPFGLLIFSMFLLFAILKAIGISSYTRYITVSLAPLLALAFWKIHPLIVAVPLTLSMILIYLMWRKNNSRSVWLLPLLFLVFANMAGGFIFIPFILLLSFVLVEVAVAATGHKKGIRALLISSVASFVAGLVNPNGLLVYIYALPTVSILGSERKIFSTLPGALKILHQNFIKESASPIFYSFFLIFFLLLFIALLVLVVRHRTKIPPSMRFLIPLLFTLALPFLWIRFVPLASFATLPWFAFSLQFFAAQINPTVRRIGIWVVYVVLFSLMIFLFGQSPQKLSPPAAQIDLIEQEHLPDTILTSPEFTGYLLYRTDRKALLDAQDDLYDENEAVHFYLYEPMILPEHLNTIQERYDTNTLLIHKDFGQLSKTLSGSDVWALVYFDYSGFIYTRRTDETGQFLDTHALTYIDFGRNLGFDPNEATQAATELETFLSRYPGNTMATGQLASIYRVTRQFERAQQRLQTIPASQQNFIVSTEFARLYAAQGRCIESERYFLKALADRHEMNFSRAVLDLAVLYAACFKDADRAKHYFERFDSFVLSADERERVRQLMDQFDIKLQNQ